MSDLARFTNIWGRCQSTLAEHETWYRKIRISRDGAPAIDADEFNRITPVIKDVVDLYINVSNEQRDSLRTFFSKTDRCSMHLYLVTANACAEFNSTPTKQNLEYALAAMSLENNRMDYRDSYVLLGRLYRTALQSGIEPEPALQHAANISDTQPISTGSESMQNFFLGFKKSAYYQSLSIP